jgi:mannitol operon repressor
MQLEHTQDLAIFLQELQKETDRGLPLVGTSFIDEKLGDTLQAFFIEHKVSSKLLDDPFSPLASFSARLDTCFALGLIDDYEYSEINILRKVRNEFAHSKHGISFKTDKITGLCSSLRSSLPEGSDYSLHDPRFRFTNAIVCIVLQLYYRPEWVKKERRVFNSDGKFCYQWVDINKEKPPPGETVVVIAKREKK